MCSLTIEQALARINSSIEGDLFFYSQYKEQHISRKEFILIVVADLAYGLNLVTLLCQHTPYEAFVATERYQAQEFLKFMVPVLFVLDEQLPGMNGLELFDLLHAQDTFSAIPTILFSRGDPRHEQQRRQRQLTTVKKPVKPDELLACIQQMLTENLHEQ